MGGGKNPLEINFHQRNRLGPPSGRTKDIVIICGPVPWKVSICQQCQPTNASFLEIEQENLFIQDREAPGGGEGKGGVGTAANNMRARMCLGERKESAK